MTGAIQGIGTETAQQLDGEGGLTAVRGCRSEELSAAAAAELSAAGCDVLFRRLHLTDGASISAMADFLVGAHGGQLDMLVNNAAVCFNDPTLFKGRVPHTPVVRQAYITVDTDFFSVAGRPAGVWGGGLGGGLPGGESGPSFLPRPRPTPLPSTLMAFHCGKTPTMDEHPPWR